MKQSYFHNVQLNKPFRGMADVIGVYCLVWAYIHTNLPKPYSVVVALGPMAKRLMAPHLHFTVKFNNAWCYNGIRCGINDCTLFPLM